MTTPWHKGHPNHRRQGFHLSLTEFRTSRASKIFWQKDYGKNQGDDEGLKRSLMVFATVPLPGTDQPLMPPIVAYSHEDAIHHI